MTTVTVEWALSKNAALEVFAQRGAKPGIVQSSTIELGPLSVEQRRVLLAQAYNPGADKLGIVNIHGQKSGTTSYPPDLSTKDYPVEFDAEPTVAQIVDAIAQLAAMAAAQKAKAEEAIAREAIRFAKQKEDEARVKSDLKQIEATLDLAAARAYALPDDNPRLKSRKEAAINSIYSKIEDAKKADWITAHGSDHLRRAHAADYDCQRLYVVERAAIEAPGWIVDYNNTGDEKARACPSMAALDIADAAKPIADQFVSGYLNSPVVVWLTDEPTSEAKSDRCEWDEEPFAPREAVRMRGYLGKYDLYKIV